MFIQWLLNQLNQYSNLILIGVTIVYVVVTWCMAKEMRRAREEERESYLVATLVPFDPKHVKIRIHNAGRGPALNIEAKFRLESTDSIEASDWRAPVLLSDAFEDFVPPSGVFELEKLAFEHDKLVVDLQWFNTFRHKHNTRYEIDLKQQKQSWDRVGFILQPDDTPTQLGKIKDELSQIRQHFDKIDSERSTKELLTRYREKNKWWRKLLKKIIQYVQSLARTKRA